MTRKDAWKKIVSTLLEILVEVKLIYAGKFMLEMFQPFLRF